MISLSPELIWFSFIVKPLKDPEKVYKMLGKVTLPEEIIFKKIPFPQEKLKWKV